jgi:hypothetical protein
LEKKPIWNIKAFQIESIEEPKNMERYSLGIWPGTIQGCNCSFIYPNYYIKGACSELNLTNKCVDVKEEKPIKFYLYFFKYK